MGRLDGKVAVITGAGSGMGQSDALLFVREGAKVVIADWHGDAAGETLRRVRLEGGEAIALTVDISNEEDVRRMTQEAVGRFGQIDILVNNAAILRGNDVTKTTLQEWNELFDTNVKGMFLCCREIIPYMLRLGKGKIINISSCGGLTAFPGSAPYCATKGAVIMFTKALAYDYASKGINVNCICPGFTDTPLVGDLMADELTKRGLLLNIPAGRFGEPEDIARTVLFFASPDSDYCDGAILSVDGGWVMK